jgi:LemA protein
MKSGSTVLIVFGVLVGAILIGAMWFVGTQNSFISMRVDTEAKWSQVQNQYQRRYDLIPRLVNSTKLYINYEGKLLTDIANARKGWYESMSGQPTQTQLDSQSQIDSVFSRLMMVVTTENYPELKADKLVLGLMDELAGTENRIATERMRYIQSVQAYNTGIQMFPGVIIADMMNLQPIPNYQANPNAQNAPNVPI